LSKQKTNIKRYVKWLDLAVNLCRKQITGFRYGYSGNYASWSEALARCNGYDTDAILEKVKGALLKVKTGQAAYERDSVLFDTIQYSWPLLAGLLHAANTNNGRLSVLDFGGSLGSSYYQNKKLLSVLDGLRWCIVEQKHFVECGKQYFEDENLHFYYDLPSCLAGGKINVAILSSVLPYLQKPYELLDTIINYGIDCIIVDRTPILLSGSSDRLTIQKIPPYIYEASYPAWFFNREKLSRSFSGKYHLLVEFNALAGKIEIKSPNSVAVDKGFIFVKKG